MLAGKWQHCPHTYTPSSFIICLSLHPRALVYISWWRSSFCHLPGSSPSPIFSNKKLSHSGFHFHLWPFTLSLNLARLSIFLWTTSLQLQLCFLTQWLSQRLHTNKPCNPLPIPWSILASGFTTLLPYMPLSTTCINKHNNSSPYSKFLHLTNIPKSLPMASSWRSCILQHLTEKPLPFS